MNINVRKILFNPKRDDRPPVLLAVTPPRTGERTLLGWRTCSSPSPSPNPSPWNWPGTLDGMALMARCQDDRVVRGQIAAHYPQARINVVPPEEDPLRLEDGEQAWAMTLRADGPEYVPLRTFRDDDLLDPGSDPLIALMGSLCDLKDGERVVSRVLLRSLGPDWAQAHLAKGHRKAVEERRDPSYTYQTGPLRLDGVTMAILGVGGRGRPPGLPVGAGRGDLEGRAPGAGNGPGADGGRLGLAPLEAVAQPGLRPLGHQGEDLPHSLRRRGAGHRHPARGRRTPACGGGPGPGGGGLPPLRPPRRGASFKVGKDEAHWRP